MRGLRRLVFPSPCPLPRGEGATQQPYILRQLERFTPLSAFTLLGFGETRPYSGPKNKTPVFPFGDTGV